MARNGIRFTDAHSAGALSGPSRYGLVTGRYFFRTPKKSEYWGYLSPYIEPERLTIGSLMRNAGYTTACVGKWHLGLDWQLKDDSKPQILTPKKFGYTNTDFSAPVKRGPTELGFDYSFILPASLDMPPYAFVRNDRVVDPDVILTADAYPKKQDETIYAWDRKHTNENDIYWERGVWWRNGEMSRSFKFEECFPTIVDEGIAFIDREGRKDKPFFLYMPLTGPHTPWLPTVQFKGSTELGTYGDFMGDIDNVVARVNAKLKELGLEKNTIVIFASDNGGAWEEEDIQQYGHQSNWSRRGQKGDAWDGGHHVPLIVHWPDHIKYPGFVPNGWLGRYIGYIGGFNRAILRADAADMSQLPVTNRWGYFPAVSLGWTVSEEKFFEPVKESVNSLKLRASWGQNGSLSALSGYAYSTDMASSGIYPLTGGNGFTTGVNPASLGNDELKWETSEQIDFGLDARFLRDRLTFSVDYYEKKTKDLLVLDTKPSLSIGGKTSPMNAGKRKQ